MFKEKEAFLRSLLRVIDGLVILLAFAVAYFVTHYLRELYQLGGMAYAIAPNIQGLFYFSQKNAALLLLSVPIWVGALQFYGVYTDFRTRPFGKLTRSILQAAVLSSIAIGSIIFLLKMTLTSRLFIGVDVALSSALLIAEKKALLAVFDFLHRRGYNQVNLIIVGTGKRARDFIRVVKAHSNWGLRIVGLIDDEHGLYGKEVEGFRVLGRLQDIPFILHHKVVDRVIFVVPRLWLHRIDQAIMACEREGIPTSISMDLYDLNIAKIRQTDFNGFPLLEFETFVAEPWQLFVKRTFDIAFSLLMLILLSPMLLLVAVAIKLDSPGPVLFKQTRCGLNGRRFTLYKFRSMIDGAEMKRRELEKMNEMDGPVFKIRRDPRITRVGRLIRRLSIDELPQLLNVLKGDMSVVGPRPALPVEVEMYELWQRRRFSLKPGLTCIWQVSGRNKVRFEKWMEMDLQYIDNWSLLLDFKILLKTFFVVLVGYGAS